MIYTSSTDSYNGFTSKISTLLGTTEVNGLLIGNNHDSLPVYIGDENVSESNYGAIIRRESNLYLPFIELSMNDNLYLYAPMTASFSVFGWHTTIPTSQYAN